MNELLRNSQKPLAAWYVATLLTLALAGCQELQPKQSRPASAARPPEINLATRQDRGATPSTPRGRLINVPPDVCHELTGPQGRTWRVATAVWDGEPARSPFESITLFVDGTWRDSSGVSGDWRFCLKSGSLAFEPHGFDKLIRATVLRRSGDEVVIEFVTHSPGMVLTLVPSARDRISEPEADVESRGTTTTTPRQRALISGDG